ncbi:MAG: GerMN domain-containing protein [Candidatus Peregrinibacteria bacterium]|nr:GerMN domain-containing protein [Candidatus Peregrinibacteria bacterium]
MKKYFKITGALLIIASLTLGCNLVKPATPAVIPDQIPTQQEQKPAEAAVLESTAQAATEPVAPIAAETPAKTMIVKVYFNNPKIDPNWDTECSNVFAVEREIPYTKSVALAAINELLKGPLSAEKTQGYMSNINSGVKVQKLNIVNSVAKIDFNEQLQYQVGGSCKISAIIAQIKQTLKQFKTIKDVIISIDGESEAILQP